MSSGSSLNGHAFALLIATGSYQDPGLAKLRSPAGDARELAAVLADPAIGGYDARSLIDEPTEPVKRAIERFLAGRRPEDTLILYLSCHGVKDPGGRLCFATASTEMDLLASTTVSADFIYELVDNCRAGRVLVLLDCCYSGAYLKGHRPRSADRVDIGSVRDRGRVVITSCTSTEYSFEIDTGLVSGKPAASAFTSAVIEGLRTGQADRDGDGLVSVDDLYSYIYERVRKATPRQTPEKKYSDVRGDFIVARNPAPPVGSTGQFRDFPVWREALRQRIAAWLEERQPSSRLLSGADLRDARQWAASHGERLSARERDYITASTRHRRRLISRVTTAVSVVAAGALVTSTAIYQHRSSQVAEALAKNMRTAAGQLSGTDPYGALQLAIRAYRTDPSVGLADVVPDSVGLASRLLPDADLDASASNGSKAATKTEPQAWWLANGAQLEIEDLTQSASEDGKTLVTTDPASHVVLWHVFDGQVRDEPLTALTDAGDVVISRSGRYIAFRQQVLPTVNPTDINAPVGSNGLPKINPGSYPTCVPKNWTSITPCLVVYDTEKHRVAFAKEFGAFPSFGGGVTMSIDPTDEILGLTVADSSLPLPPAGFRNTLYLFNLRTGELLRKIRLPWQSLIGQLWLGPGARSALITEGLLNGNLSLSFLHLRHDTLTRRQLVAPARLTRVAFSLDGRIMAALLTGVHGGSGQLVAWNTATGAVTARITSLRPAQVNGTLALDATGSTAWLSSPPDIGTMHATNLQQITAGITQHGSVWSLTSRHQVARFVYPEGWESVWPLGSGTHGPLVLIDGNTLGVVAASPGGPAPLAKVTTAASSGQSGATAGIGPLCSLLGGEVNEQDQAAQDRVPSGAYQGQLCP